jgi:hypothetical protein
MSFLRKFEPDYLRMLEAANEGHVLLMDTVRKSNGKRAAVLVFTEPTPEGDGIIGYPFAEMILNATEIFKPNKPIRAIGPDGKGIIGVFDGTKKGVVLPKPARMPKLPSQRTSTSTALPSGRGRSRRSAGGR